MALMLHLLVELAVLVDPTDPAGILTALGGMGVVVVTLAPFAVAFAMRAHRSWSGSPRPEGARGP
ncbi:hypothetical protein [Azospirillum halopraeferens]|uniref:hypothetical protein n=1 Tax=Azospirillum halopraeferens TaxID=34010 RepID=UPI000425DAF7|nr:hypothetical protein [Azospirillum halopraeferens]